MIGMMGAHRTGKTTLARAVADELRLPFVPASVSSVMKNLGVDPKLDLRSMEARLVVHDAILAKLRDVYMAHGSEMIVTDRTPLDVLLYTWTQVQRESVPEELVDRFNRSTVRAYELTNLFFTQIWNVQPGIELVADDHKGPLNRPYIDHLNMLVLGVMDHPLLQVPGYRIPRNMTDLGLRVNLVVANAVDRISSSRTQHLSS